MAALVSGCRGLTRIPSVFRPLASSVKFLSVQKTGNASEPADEVTHTGQSFAADDYRLARFVDKKKLVNQNWAIDLIAEDPVVVCEDRVVSSSGGGALGHPKVFINLDPPGVHSCGYSGRKFVLKKYYDASSMGPSVTYEEYLAEKSE